jgi:hypothetical protein
MLWLITLPIRSARRRAAEKAAAYQLELEMVAAMPEPMKEEYWRQKHADAQAKALAPALQSSSASSVT